MTSFTPERSLSKYRQAGFGFFALNTIYLVIVLIFLSSFNLNISVATGLVFDLLIVVILSYLVYKGKRTLALILAIIFLVRSAVSIYSLVSEQAFPAVPYVIPLLLLTSYFLGRAVWNWP